MPPPFLRFLHCGRYPWLWNDEHVLVLPATFESVVVLCPGLVSDLCHHVAIYYHVSDLGSFSLLDRSSLRSSSRYLAEIFVEIFLAMTTGWDDRGNRGDRQPDDCTKLWIGNLCEDLTPQVLTDWLTDRDFQLERPVELVPWRLKRAEETISFTECPYPHPTVTPTLAVRSVWEWSRNCRDTRVTGVMLTEEMISDTECPHPHHLHHHHKSSKT